MGSNCHQEGRKENERGESKKTWPSVTIILLIYKRDGGQENSQNLQSFWMFLSSFFSEDKRVGKCIKHAWIQERLFRTRHFVGFSCLLLRANHNSWVPSWFSAVPALSVLLGRLPVWSTFAKGNPTAGSWTIKTSCANGTQFRKSSVSDLGHPRPPVQRSPRPAPLTVPGIHL